MSRDTGSDDVKLRELSLTCPLVEVVRMVTALALLG